MFYSIKSFDIKPFFTILGGTISLHMNTACCDVVTLFTKCYLGVSMMKCMVISDEYVCLVKFNIISLCVITLGPTECIKKNSPKLCQLAILKEADHI